MSFNTGSWVLTPTNQSAINLKRNEKTLTRNKVFELFSVQVLEAIKNKWTFITIWNQHLRSFFSYHLHLGPVFTVMLLHVKRSTVTFPVVSSINHVFKFFHLSHVWASVACKGDKWNSKELVAVTSNHHWERNSFHVLHQKTPGSHLRSEGIRIGAVYCVKMRTQATNSSSQNL